MRMQVAIAAALAAGVCSSQTVRHKEVATFGSQQVELRVVSEQTLFPEDTSAVERLAGEKDPAEQERLSRIEWEKGEASYLYFLADFAERRGDYVAAYAHAYALRELSKLNARVNPPGKVRGKAFAIYANRVNQLGKKLSSSQRAAAVQQAAQLVRDNPNCCFAM